MQFIFNQFTQRTKTFWNFSLRFSISSMFNFKCMWTGTKWCHSWNITSRYFSNPKSFLNNEYIRDMGLCCISDLSVAQFCCQWFNIFSYNISWNHIFDCISMSYFPANSHGFITHVLTLPIWNLFNSSNTCLTTFDCIRFSNILK